MSSPSGETKRGIIYTFYAFKGGTGRTMALANVATLLAKWGRSVLVVDWDLEAPGIERYFAKDESNAAALRASHPGIIDLMLRHENSNGLKWRDCVIKLESGISLITAGREDGNYIDRMQKLDFEGMFKAFDLGKFIEQLRTDWLASFDFILIDSRTGVTDIGGICTIQLPDVLVLFFTANESSTKGALEIVRRAREGQSKLPVDRGHLLAVPIPSRDESRTEFEKASQWKSRFALSFSSLYKDWLPTGIGVSDAIEILRIPYVPYWSFGEQLPVLQEGTNDPSSLGYAYEVLARLLASKLDWYEALEGRKVPPPGSFKPREINEGWLDRHRSSASEGLKNSGRAGFHEVCHICTDYPVNKEQSDLLAIAETAAIHTFGWPIGVVLRNREGFRPRPTNDGIVAKIQSEHAYDYWTLSKNGDFYSLMSLFEDDRELGGRFFATPKPPSSQNDQADRKLFFDTRVVRATEAVLHCINLYKAFGVEPGASVTLLVRFGGLKGRRLTVISPNRVLLSTEYKNEEEDEVTSKFTFRLGINEAEITQIVMAICAPLFMIFNFARFDEPLYREIVTSFINGRVI